MTIGASDMRDELANLVARTSYEYSPGQDRSTGRELSYEDDDTSYEEGEARVIADAILAAGYRKPRTINKIPELNQLPIGTIVRDCDGRAWTRDRSCRSFPENVWSADGVILTSGAVRLPALVLYVPEAPNAV